MHGPHLRTPATITLRLAGDICLDDSNLGRTAGIACDEIDHQHWKLTPSNGAYYTVSAEDRGSAWCLDIHPDDGDADTRNQLRMAKCANVSGQHWKFTPADGDSFLLTTEWRGDKKCLAIVELAAKLVDCANVGGQRWKFNRESVGANTKIDGEVAISRSFKPTFVLFFYKGSCGFELPDVHGATADLFECATTGKKTITCTIRPGRLWNTSTEPQRAFDAIVATDTATTLKFATPSGSIELKPISNITSARSRNEDRASR